MLSWFKSSSRQKAAREQAASAEPTTRATALNRSALKVESPDALLEPHLPMLQSLIAFTQLDEARFNLLYMELFRNLARWCQHIPASERHHHSHLGGLLEHSIEVAVYSARIAGRFLYIADGEEQISQWQALYIYAMTSAGALHDIGKLMTDVDIVMVNGEKKIPWLPHKGPMPIGTKYIYRHNDRRQHGIHEAAGLPLVFQIMPEAALGWIWKKPVIRNEWLATIGGKAMDLGGNIGRCVIECDSQSTSDAMLDAPVTTAAQASADNSLAKKPQIHALALKGILLSMRDFEPNKKGSPYWVSQQFVACVSPRFTECIRSSLGSESQFLPENTSLIYDTMGDNGMLIPNSAGKAMHTLMFSQNQKPLAVILIKRKVIDPELSLPVYPGRLLCPSVAEQYHHQIATGEAQIPPNATTSEQSSSKSISVPNRQEQHTPTQQNGSSKNASEKSLSGSSMGPSSTLAAHQKTRSTTSEVVQTTQIENSTSDRNRVSGASANVQIREEGKGSDSPDEHTIDIEEHNSFVYPLTMQVEGDSYKEYMTNRPQITKEKPSGTGETRSDVASNFIEWFRAQIITATMPVNAKGGEVHIVSGNRLAIVSPAVFFKYLDQSRGIRDQDASSRRAMVSKLQHSLATHFTFERSIIGGTMIQADIVGMRRSGNFHVMVFSSASTRALQLDLDYSNANRFITLSDIG